MCINDVYVCMISRFRLTGQLQPRLLGSPLLLEPLLRRHRMSPAQQELSQALRPQRRRRHGPRQAEALPDRRQIRPQMQIRAGLFTETDLRFATATAESG